MTTWVGARQNVFEAIGSYGHGQTLLLDRDDPYRVDLLGVGGRTLELLRVRPVLGRAINADDSRENAPPVMMLGYDMWQKRYGGDPLTLTSAVVILVVTIMLACYIPAKRTASVDPNSQRPGVRRSIS